MSVEARERHEQAVRTGAPTYLDPDTGYTVFSAVGHLERGHCCGNACRHCPYTHAERVASGAVPAD